MKKRHENYRIVEFLGEYKIQEKEIRIKYHGCLWWQKKKEIISWRNLDEKGQWTLKFEQIGYRFSPYFVEPKLYKTLEEAKSVVDSLVRGEVIHIIEK